MEKATIINIEPSSRLHYSVMKQWLETKQSIMFNLTIADKYNSIDSLELHKNVDKFEIITTVSSSRRHSASAKITHNSKEYYLTCSLTLSSINNIESTIYTDDESSSSEIIKLLFGHLEESKVEKDKLEVKFWSYSSQVGGANINHRDLDAYSFSEIKENYSEENTKEIESLINTLTNKDAKLIIWSGPPGTGKTTALRTVLKEKMSATSSNYIIDPETFFGGPPSYMMSVILSDAESEEWDYESGSYVNCDPKTTIIILEDCGELIKQSAKAEVGAGLTKFLNIIDGMIGQGLDLKVILTTNEEIETFHSAVTRPGRIHSMINFEKLSKEKSNSWLKKRGIEKEVDEPKTIAELFDLTKESETKIEKNSLSEKKNKVGFV